MADSSERGAGKPASAGPSTSSGARRKEGRVAGGKVVASRYMDYEKKTTRKPPATDALETGGKIPGGVKKPSQLQKSKDRSGVAKGDLQSTLLEGHGSAPPDLDLSAINEKSTVRKTPQLEKTRSEKTESTSFSAPRKKSPSLSEEMEMMESQTLLLTLLVVKMEKGLAQFEEEAEKHLLKLCKEKEELQKKTHELKRSLLLCQKKRELEEALDAQIEMLSPFEAVAERFKEQYKTFATALDTTRHELPVRSIHLEGDGQQFLGFPPRPHWKTLASVKTAMPHPKTLFGTAVLPERDFSCPGVWVFLRRALMSHLTTFCLRLLQESADALQSELKTTQKLLRELGIGNSETNVQVLDLLGELKDVAVKKDLELQRSLAQLQELSAEASKEAALINQGVWEEAQGPATPSRWYFSEDSACEESRGAVESTSLPEDNAPHAPGGHTHAVFTNPSEDRPSSR
ncbi:HAUS augmin-like complex subunit 8 isoform X2 [Lemur catta]|uniref:HAUS augmin-like complex subunit 8 isoform X2 n=1 Tax=Lemur catta TaxID=9447 RepID=UPI001E26CF06|nr:HAUS augmin-like complex subunit 8 isoform X2 [Lemur catta]